MKALFAMVAIVLLVVLVSAGTNPKTSNPPAATAPAPAIVHHPSRAKSRAYASLPVNDCGGGIAVNRVTTCGFAENVAAAYRSQGAPVSIEAASPVTGKTYHMACSASATSVACRGGVDAVVVFPPSPPQTSSPTPSESTEDVGSLSHAGDTEFCSTHSCIPSFSGGAGSVVQCADGEYSHSGGIQGACSDHGGEE